MYAVIETGGKQYKVENGDIVFVEKLSAADDSTVDFKVVADGRRRWSEDRHPLCGWRFRHR